MLRATLTIISAALLLIVCLWWVRSYWRADYFQLGPIGGDRVIVITGGGEVVVFAGPKQWVNGGRQTKTLEENPRLVRRFLGNLLTFGELHDRFWVRRNFALGWGRQPDITLFLGAPLWAIAAPLTVLPYWMAWRWFAPRHEADGRCPACGYDLRKSPQACPECGQTTL